MVEYAFDPVDAVAEPGQELDDHQRRCHRHSYLIVDLAKGVELAGRARSGTLQLPDDVEPGHAIG